jgi:hypothetical protein
MVFLLGVFAFAPAGIQVFTDSPHFDEGGAYFKEAAKQERSHM